MMFQSVIGWTLMWSVDLANSEHSEYFLVVPCYHSAGDIMKFSIVFLAIVVVTMVYDMKGAVNQFTCFPVDWSIQIGAMWFCSASLFTKLFFRTSSRTATDASKFSDVHIIHSRYILLKRLHRMYQRPLMFHSFEWPHWPLLGNFRIFLCIIGNRMAHVKMDHVKCKCANCKTIVE